MRSNTVNNPEISVNPAHIEGWEAFLLNPYNIDEPPNTNGFPQIIRMGWEGGYYEDRSTRKVAAGITYLGIKKNTELDIAEQLQMVRLDWDTQKPEKVLPDIVTGLAKRFDQQNWQHTSFLPSEGFPGGEFMSSGSLFIAEVNVPSSNKIEARKSIRVIGPLGEVATNPVVEALINRTVVPDYSKSMSMYLENLRSQVSQTAYQEAA